MDQETTTPDHRTALPRRTLLQGAVVTGAAVPLLAACGSDSSGGGDAAGSGDAGGAPSAGTTLTPASDVPVGSGVIVAGAEVVVTQPTEGEFKGFSAVCTHKGCIVSDMQGDKIHCKCHGSEFSITDGSVITGPATEPLASVTVQKKGSDIVTG